jgi:hypothetical protein
MTWNEETRILKADDGKWITNGDTYAIEAKLAPSESVENWWEIDKLPTEDDDVLRGTSEIDGGADND